MDSVELVHRKYLTIPNKKLAFIPVLLLVLLVVLSLIFTGSPASVANNSGISFADTAWMLTATALVLIMTPGLAFFYGGMVSKKNVISTMLQSFISMVLISLLWVVIGFSLSFGESIGGIIGDPRSFFMMNDVLNGNPW